MSRPRCAACATVRSAPQLVEIHRLEDEGDRLHTLEAAVDACETVANVLEGIAIKRARR